MWLRDHVPTRIANARVSLYGYASEVGVSDSISTLSEMSEAFVMDLVNWRGLGSLDGPGKVRQFTLRSFNTHPRFVQANKIDRSTIL